MLMDKFREECGVFGIFGHTEAANLTYLGLYALQHRGQESAGIAASDGTQIRLSKAMGYVNDAFDATALASLPGDMAIGHVRYSTAGESKVANAHPIVIDSVHGQFAICHNGNLVNAGEVREMLVREGAIFQTTSDTEVIVHLYARSREEGSERAIVDAISQVRGAFSFVMMTPNRMLGVRDPHGFRPLAIGKLGDAWVLCSETCALDLIGARYVRDVEPGELVVLSETGIKSLKPFAPAPQAQCIFEHVYFCAARQLRLRRKRQRGQDRVGPPAGPRVPCRGGRRCPDSGLWGVRRGGLLRRLGHSHAHGAHPEPLRGPNIHSAAAVDPALRRQGEAQPGAQHHRGQAGGSCGRLDRARHDQSQDRAHDSRGRRARSPYAHQLSSDRISLFLWCRYAQAIRVDCRHPHARGDPQVPQRRQYRLPQS